MNYHQIKYGLLIPVYQYLTISLRYWLKYPKLKSALKAIEVSDEYETLNYLIKNKCSISRFGDGEFFQIRQFVNNEKYVPEQTFQVYDPVLGERLYHILIDKDLENHKVGLQHCFFHLDSKVYTRTELIEIKNRILLEWPFMSSILNPAKHYLDANFTRFYMSKRNKKLLPTYVKRMKEIWKDRDICFVEGEHSCLGVGNNLFDNARSITRILCPAESAFNSYDNILATAKQQPKNTLILIALGMTATVLAYDLHKEGFQAIDLGHVDIEYEWMLLGATKKVAIPHKYTNETVDGKNPKENLDKVYQSQIIARVGID